eukprot:3193810-Alexandrium_andersonii.AAC.1
MNPGTGPAWRSARSPGHRRPRPKPRRVVCTSSNVMANKFKQLRLRDASLANLEMGSACRSGEAV